MSSVHQIYAVYEELLAGASDGEHAYEERLRVLRSAVDTIHAEAKSLAESKATFEKVSSRSVIVADLSGLKASMDDYKSSLHTAVQELQSDARNRDVVASGLSGVQEQLGKFADSLDTATEELQKDTGSRTAAVNGLAEFRQSLESFTTALNTASTTMQGSGEKQQEGFDRRVEHVTSAVNHLKDEVTKMPGDISNVSMALDVLTEQVKKHLEAQDHVEQANAQARSSLGRQLADELEPTWDKVSSSLKEVQAEIGSLKKAMPADLEGKLATVMGSVDATATALDALANPYTGTIASYVDRLDKTDYKMGITEALMINHVDGSSLQTLTGVETMEANLTDQMDVLKGDLDGMQGDSTSWYSFLNGNMLLLLRKLASMQSSMAHGLGHVRELVHGHLHSVDRRVDGFLDTQVAFREDLEKGLCETVQSSIREELDAFMKDQVIDQERCFGTLKSELGDVRRELWREQKRYKETEQAKQEGEVKIESLEYRVKVLQDKLERSGRPSSYR